MLQKLVKKLGRDRKGFTLIELIVVIAILGILAAVLIPTVGNIVGNAQQSAADADASTVYMAAQLYQTTAINGQQDNGKDLTPLDKSTTYTSANFPDTLLSSSYFTSINAKIQKGTLSGVTIVTDSNSMISSVQVTEYSKPGNYPKS